MDAMVRQGEQRGRNVPLTSTITVREIDPRVVGRQLARIRRNRATPR
jgi:hypothetical protein